MFCCFATVSPDVISPHSIAMLKGLYLFLAVLILTGQKAKASGKDAARSLHGASFFVVNKKHKNLIFLPSVRITGISKWLSVLYYFPLML